MRTIETSINEYAEAYQEFITSIACAHTMSEKPQNDTVLRVMHKAWKRAGDAAFKCNAIAERIGFNSLTAGFHSMMTPQEALDRYLHKTDKAAA